jgi:hypothetical protein
MIISDLLVKREGDDDRVARNAAPGSGSNLCPASAEKVWGVVLIQSHLNRPIAYLGMDKIALFSRARRKTSPILLAARCITVG